MLSSHMKFAFAWAYCRYRGLICITCAIKIFIISPIVIKIHSPNYQLFLIAPVIMSLLLFFYVINHQRRLKKQQLICQIPLSRFQQFTVTYLENTKFSIYFFHAWYLMHSCFRIMQKGFITSAAFLPLINQATVSMREKTKLREK